MKAEVYITLKDGVLDPQGKAIQRSLGQLDFQGVESVTQGKYIELKLADSLNKEQAKEQVEKMCQKLLANTVIEDYRVEIA